MEMEHINENTIRVLIRQEDLQSRGINFLDLMGSQSDIEQFFYSILDEVDVEEEFVDTDMVSFQVMPRGNSLELLISKGAPAISPENFIDRLKTLPDGVHGFFDIEEEPEEENEFIEELSIIPEVVLELESFEDMIQLASEVYLRATMTTLYKLQEKYYLHVLFMIDEVGMEEYKDDKAQLLEFGKLATITVDVLNEHGEKLMERNAMELTRHYFPK
ncbi:MAG: adaptor protein MecA [Lactobacillales bacterium]|jgi:adapter protein MecA 1/2|nr:adaptor protein MecA [Lactobacillales bacterium]